MAPGPVQLALLRDLQGGSELGGRGEDHRRRLAWFSAQHPGGADPEPAGEGKPREGDSSHSAQGSGTHLVQGGIGDGHREIGTRRVLGIQQRKEAQDCKGPGQRHGKTRMPLESQALVAGG